MPGLAWVLEDAGRGATLAALVRARQPRSISRPDWLHLDEIETARGQATGRPRVELTRVEERLAAPGR